MKTPTKKVGMGLKSNRHTNNPDLSKLDRAIALGWIETSAEAEGWSLDQREESENEIDKMPMYL
jgi:hypothetical protein